MRDWLSGALSDNEYEEHRRVYGEHLSEISPSLRDGAEQLVSSIYLHDAQILERSLHGGTFELAVLAGDLQRGYERLRLVYEDATVADTSPPALNDANLEIVADEVDLAGEGGFEHRLLLVPDGEISIRFGSLRVTREPATPSERQFGR
jgi:hypothetical protein